MPAERYEIRIAGCDDGFRAFAVEAARRDDRPAEVLAEVKLALTPYVRAAFRGGDEKHYSDFPAYQSNSVAEATM